MRYIEKTCCPCLPFFPHSPAFFVAYFLSLVSCFSLLLDITVFVITSRFLFLFCLLFDFPSRSVIISFYLSICLCARAVSVSICLCVCFCLHFPAFLASYLLSLASYFSSRLLLLALYMFFGSDFCSWFLFLIFVSCQLFCMSSDFPNRSVVFCLSLQQLSVYASVYVLVSLSVSVSACLSLSVCLRLLVSLSRCLSPAVSLWVPFFLHSSAFMLPLYQATFLCRCFHFCLPWVCLFRDHGWVITPRA